MMKNFNSMLIKPWSEENHLMIFQSSNPRKKVKSEEDNKASENPYDKIEPVILTLGIQK